METDDQASRLRKLMHKVRQTRTIALASGKGGVGKSNIAVNLSILLSAAGQRVALVDADLGLANIDVLLDVDVRANLSHVIAGKRKLADVIIDLPSGVQFIPGANGLGGLANLSAFQRAQLMNDLTVLEGDNDIIMVDCAAGIGPDVLQFATNADDVLVITTPEPTAITDAYAMVKMLSQNNYDGRVSLLINQVASRQQARETYQRISGVAKQFLNQRTLDAGYVLSDMKVREAVARREPFVLAYPRCSASRCLAALANKLSAGGRLVGRREGFFRRVSNWFA